MDAVDRRWACGFRRLAATVAYTQLFDVPAGDAESDRERGARESPYADGTARDHRTDPAAPLCSGAFTP